MIESVIDRCLQKDPALRPSSALQVAAALPGGDPLAAALAAGETPSPEMVAAAPREGALHPGIAVACLAAVLLGLFLLIATSGRVRLERNLPLEKPPEVLAANAREILTELGYTDRGVDNSYAFGIDPSPLRVLDGRDRPNWELIKTGQPATIYFWYRQSPRFLVPGSSTAVSLDDPPTNVSGMTNVVLDLRGRLIGLEHLPPQVDEPSPAAIATNWSPLFAAAGLDLQNFRPTNPRWIPSMYADERAAWEGLHPDHSNVAIRIEAAAYKNKPVHFEIIFPWDRPLRQEEEQLTSGERAAAIILATLFFGVLLGAAFLGRRNLQLGRSDKKGAFRLALFIFLVVEIGLIIGTRHAPALGIELELIFRITSYALVPSALIWLLYIALEPHVRRRWPRLIISWTRLMGGEFRDPMVGRDLLIGGLLGVGRSLAIALGIMLAYWLDQSAPPIPSMRPETLMGLRGLLSLFLSNQIVLSVVFGLVFLFLLLLVYIIVRKQWLAAVALWIIAVAVELLAFASTGPKLFWIVSILIATLIVIAVARFGLLAMISNQLFFLLSFMYPMTQDFSVWYIQSFLFPLVIMLGLAGYAFYISLGGQRVFKGTLLRE